MQNLQVTRYCLLFKQPLKKQRFQKIFSTFIGFAAIIPSIDNNGKMNYTATNILALVSYFYITCTYDIPNLYRTYNSNMEMAKIKRELLNK